MLRIERRARQFAHDSRPLLDVRRIRREPVTNLLHSSISADWSEQVRRLRWARVGTGTDTCLSVSLRILKFLFPRHVDSSRATLADLRMITAGPRVAGSRSKLRQRNPRATVDIAAVQPAADAIHHSSGAETSNSWVPRACKSPAHSQPSQYHRHESITALVTELVNAVHPFANTLLDG